MSIAFKRMHGKIIREEDIMYIKRLKDLREDNDKKQKDIAEILQITRQQYSLYETGKKGYTIWIYNKISKIL